MKSAVIDVLICSLALIALFPVLGACVNFILSFILKSILGIIDKRGMAYMIFVNYLTIPGVIHHELSHALFAFLSGAKITEINIYRVSFDSLGSVSYSPRGPLLLRGLQCSLSSMAPVFTGLISEYFLIRLIINGRLPVLLLFLVAYLIIAIGIHMDMSSQDILVYLKGCPCVFIILFIILLLVKFYVFPDIWINCHFCQFI